MVLKALFTFFVDLFFLYSLVKILLLSNKYVYSMVAFNTGYLVAKLILALIINVLT